MPSNARPTARSASATSCASAACSCRPAGCAQSGFEANFKARLKALEAKIAVILSALEKKKLDDEAWGEIDTAHPGYLGSGYVLCRHVGRADLSADTSIPTPRPPRPLHHRLRSPPPHAQRQCRSTSFTICLLRIHRPGNRVLRTRRASRLPAVLAINDIEHTKTKASPQTNGICERLPCVSGDVPDHLISTNGRPLQ